MTAPVFQAESPNHPERNADLLLESLYTDDNSGAIRIVYHRNGYRFWNGEKWKPVDDLTLSSQIYGVLKNAVWINRDGDPSPFSCTTGALNNIMNAVKHETVIDEGVNLPAWINGRSLAEPRVDPPMPADEMVAAQNCVVHAPTRRWFAHSPQFFNNISVPFSYDPNYGPPEQWLNFLAQTWADDHESIECLQEIFGYCLINRTDLHKMFMLIGAPRSGKSTISNILRDLLGGGESVASTSFDDLNGAHGLHQLRDKQLAVLPDVRFHAREHSLAVSRLLNITGGDEVSINPKNRDMYTARLSVRFLIVSNELPKLSDESGAIRSRVVLLKTLDTVPEHLRDSRLEEKLKTEFPGIFNWALDGLDRLLARGYFQQPKSGREDLDTMAYLSSPTTAFRDEFLHSDLNASVPVNDVYHVYKTWCNEYGVRAKDKTRFGADLRSIFPRLSVFKPRVDGRQVRTYAGIGLNEAGLELIMQRDGVASLTGGFS